jgi:hypothetical protein
MTYRSSANEIDVSVSVRPARQTTLRVLLPKTWTSCRARLDGRAVAVERTTEGEDAYAVLAIDARRPHQLRLRAGGDRKSDSFRNESIAARAKN